jgi:hypothetical protein
LSHKGRLIVAKLLDRTPLPLLLRLRNRSWLVSPRSRTHYFEQVVLHLVESVFQDVRGHSIVDAVEQLCDGLLALLCAQSSEIV